VECVVYGVGSTYVYEVHETLRRLSWPVCAYVANLEGGFRPSDLTPLMDASALTDDLLRLPVVFALVTPGHRRSLEREVLGRGFSAFPSVVDPTTVVASSASMADGTMVNAAGVVGANSTLGRFVSLNRSVSVGHDAVIDDYASLGPGCVLCGGCTVGRGAFIGAGAVLNPGVSVGPNAVVGAGAVVAKDVPERSVAVGNPARVVREGIAGYNDVTVDEEPRG